MNPYVSALQQAAFIYPVIVILFTIPYILYNYHKYGSVFSLRIVVVYSFILYMLCVYCLVILPLPSPEAAKMLHGRRMQLVPFSFVGAIAKNTHIVLSQPKTWLTLINNDAFLTNLYNLFMTMPFGVYMRYYFRKSWKQTLVLSFCLSLFFELTQLSGLYFIYPGAYRLFDVDDLIVNTAGGMAGYALTAPFMKILPPREELDKLSYRRGVSVSFLRRLTSALIDLALVGGMGLIGVIVFAYADKTYSAWAFEAMALAYFCIVPIFCHGRTLGKKWTNLRIVSRSGKSAAWYQYILRGGSLYLATQFIPDRIIEIIQMGSQEGTLSGLASIVMIGICAGVYLGYPLFASIMMTLHKPLFYEKISRTQVVSTVKATGKK